MARNNFPFWGRRAGCDAMRSERRVASHTNEEQRRSAPALRPQNGKLFWAMSSPRHATVGLGESQVAASSLSSSPVGRRITPVV